MEELASGSAATHAGLWAGVSVAALLYVALSLAIGARLAVGRYAALRVAEESGLRTALDPGSQLWVATQLIRQLALVLVPVLAFEIGGKDVIVAAGAGAFAIVLGRVAQDLLAPRVPEALLTAAAPLLRVIHALFGWIVRPLARSHQRIAQSKARDDAELDDDRREEQLEEVIRDAEEGGLLERAQGELVREIVDLAGVTVVEVMTPRTEVSAVEADIRAIDAARTMIESKHSRLPVYEGALDRVIGVVSVRDLLPHLLEGAADAPVRTLMRPVPLVPATKLALELLREFQQGRQQLAIVVDEYGGTAGLVTIEDLVEEIVGDIRDEHELEEEYCKPDGAGGWHADGLMTIEDFEDLIDLELHTEGVETVGGLVFQKLGRIPRVGDAVEVTPGVEIKVADMRARRIARVHIARHAVVEPGAEAED